MMIGVKDFTDAFRKRIVKIGEFREIISPLTTVLLHQTNIVVYTGKRIRAFGKDQPKDGICFVSPRFFILMIQNVPLKIKI